jgi:hypothetical protein
MKTLLAFSYRFNRLRVKQTTFAALIRAKGHLFCKSDLFANPVACRPSLFLADLFKNFSFCKPNAAWPASAKNLFDRQTDY